MTCIEMNECEAQSVISLLSRTDILRRFVDFAMSETAIFDWHPLQLEPRLLSMHILTYLLALALRMARSMDCAHLYTKTFLKDHTPERSYTPLLHGSNQTLLPDPSWPLSSSLLIISILLYL